MRLLVISTELPPGPGGIGSHAHQLTQELTEQGLEATVLGPQDYVSASDAAAWRQARPFEVLRLHHLPGPPLQGLAWAVTLARKIRQRRPHCVLASGQRAVWLAAAVAPRFGCPVLAVAHGTELLSNRAWERKLTRWAFERVDCVVAVSQYTRGLLLDAGIRPRQLEVIPNGADSRAFDDVANPQNGVAGSCDPPGPPSDALSRALPQAFLAPETRLLITVGRLCERKGQDLVLKALPHVIEAVGEVRYIAVGLPERAEFLGRLAAELGVEDRVDFPGRLPTEVVRELLGRADLFVLPSRRTPGGDVEGYGIAVVEAALCGLPAVVTRDSGLVEAILPGQTGLAVAPDDLAALAEALIELLQNEPLRQRMAKAARRRAHEEQTWQRRSSQYAALLGALSSGPVADPDTTQHSTAEHGSGESGTVESGTVESGHTGHKSAAERK